MRMHAVQSFDLERTSPQKMHVSLWDTQSLWPMALCWGSKEPSSADPVLKRVHSSKTIQHVPPWADATQQVLVRGHMHTLSQDAIGPAPYLRLSTHQMGHVCRRVGERRHSICCARRVGLWLLCQWYLKHACFTLPCHGAAAATVVATSRVELQRRRHGSCGLQCQTISLISLLRLLQALVGGAGALVHGYCRAEGERVDAHGLRMHVEAVCTHGVRAPPLPSSGICEWL